MKLETSPPEDRSVPDHPVPLRHAGTFFVSTLIGAAFVALFAGDASMTWGYIGAFTIALALGLGMALRADQHNRALERQRRTP